jgi:hypothetical protein
VTIGLDLRFSCHAAHRTGHRGDLGWDASRVCSSEARSVAVPLGTAVPDPTSLEHKLRTEDAR